MAQRTRIEQERKAASPQKPLLRGWFHAVAAIASGFFTVALLLASSADLPRMISMLVFGLSMVQLYSVSAIYHMGRWRAKVHRILRSLDHSNIFVLIAGTYTPLGFNILTGWQRGGILITVWLLALIGVAVAIFDLGLPRWVSTAIYIGMGWLSLLMMPAYLGALPWQAVGLMLLGGLLYTVGAIVYARKRPNPWPRVFGFHEIFHLFVIAGSITFSIVIWLWALPFPRQA
jgi:hemolysin III